jgi:hypothetical protein
MSIAMRHESRWLVTGWARATLAPLAACYIIFFLIPTTAEGHGGGPGLAYDPCVQHAGADDFIHLAVYQPQFNPFAEFCDSLPQEGRTILVFDLMGTDLPEASLSLQVFDQAGRSQLFVPAQLYRAGIASLSMDLPRGKYTVLVSVVERDGSRRLAFPLAVGAWWDRLIMPLLIVVLIGIVTTAYCVLQIRGLGAERNDSTANTRIGLRIV